MNVRTVLNLSQEAVDIIDAHAPSVNKKGSWASQAIAEYARIMAATTELSENSEGILERIDSRLARIEKQVVIAVVGKKQEAVTE